MVTLTIAMPDHHKNWIDSQIEQGSIASTSDYVSELIQRDRRARGEIELTLDDLRHMVEEADASGFSDETVASIFARVTAAKA
jgi:putative addiction module CopG family antidote